ncbi:hydrolase [Actinoplanes awajinensis subsp. mycoplanecinus]|uniref:Hydrolase n=2 Tax=Actinoplanes awajinensis TaxID=135946 RepID=A0A117MQY8_9ACTN|nr:hydrolase [Actinoplanes awajinensis subsp. mycoplanecinus]
MLPVWDMDGTLIDSSRVVPAAFVRTVAELGAPPVTAEQVVAAYGRGTPEVILDHLTGRALSAAEHDVYYRHLDGVPVTAYPDVAATLAALRAAALPVTVFTGASTRAARILLAAAGLDTDLIIGGDQVEHPKPAPDGMLLAAAELGTTAGRLILVGDSFLDLRAAAAAGSRSAAAGWGHRHDPAEPADFRLATPLDLLAIIGCPGPAGAPILAG